MLPALNTRFVIEFPNGQKSHALRVMPDTPADSILRLLGLKDQVPTIFVTGGASYMSAEDMQRTREIIFEVGRFAAEHGITVIDGGTESGVMQIVGEARDLQNLDFPLIGVSPLGRVSYPGYTNPNEEAFLEDSHTHFVLVDASEWGGESHVILRLTRSLAGEGQCPAVGILINGGKIAMQEIYLAATKELHLPMLVIDGSGRSADEVATAFKTGKANQKLLRAILRGGDIQLIGAAEGAEAMRQKLTERFSKR